MKNFLYRLQHWAGSLLFVVKYKLGIAKEGEDFFTYGSRVPEHMPYPKEFRCEFCKSRYECPAYNTGVIFPCAYFKEEHHGTEE